MCSYVSMSEWVGHGLGDDLTDEIEGSSRVKILYVRVQSETISKNGKSPITQRPKAVLDGYPLRPTV